MSKREDESYLNQMQEKVDTCPHGHWRPLCNICAKKKDIFANIVWLSEKEVQDKHERS